MGSDDSPGSRNQQYQSVLTAVTGQPRFQIERICQEVPQIPRPTIARIVRELTSVGWLSRERTPAVSGESPSVWYVWRNDPAKFGVQAFLQRQAGHTTITESPRDDRPRERLLSLGAANLKNAELLAILIRAGRTGESAVQAGEKLAAAFADSIGKLPLARPAELRDISRVVGEAAYCQIMAGIELGRRIAAVSERAAAPKRISSTTDAISYCREQFARLVSDGSQEEFHVVCLDTKNQVIAPHRVFIGTLNASLIHPREIFRHAIKDAASTVILVHNHPSGDPTPSPEDFQATERLERAGSLLGIDVLDHIVVASSGCVSIREARC